MELAVGGGAEVFEGEVAEALGAGGVEELEVAVDVLLEGGVEEMDGGGGGDFEGAGVSGVGDDGEVEALGLGRVVGRWRGTGFDGEQAAGDGDAGSADFDAGAADGGVELEGGGVFAEGDGEGAELLVERRG